MGARGNSGVILSQLLRGLQEHWIMKSLWMHALLNKAFAESRNTAYKGVVRPVEGTILTVSKDIASASEDIVETETDDLLEILDGIIKAGEISLENTPNLLPILKQAGVVDSGGKGLIVILEGIYRAAIGEKVDIGEVEPDKYSLDLDQINQNGMHEEIEDGQDFEVVVDFLPNKDFEFKISMENWKKSGHRSKSEKVMMSIGCISMSQLKKNMNQLKKSANLEQSRKSTSKICLSKWVWTQVNPIFRIDLEEGSLRL